jgi:hypothetical protein
MNKILKTIGYTLVALAATVAISYAAINIVPNGGTGVGTITGLIKGNGTSPFTAASAGTDYQSPITLTTTGTSGAATLISNTLNIPQYSGGGGSGLTVGTTTISSGTNGDVEYNNSGVLGELVPTISGVTLGNNLNSLTATNGSLTFSGSYNGGTARTIGLNVGNANTWSALQTFGTNISIGGVTATGATGTGNVVFGTSPTLTGASLGSSTATTQSPSDNSTKVATTAYTDAAIAAAVQGLSIKQSVQEATAAALPTNTYLSGVITITATGTLTVDGVTVALNDRVLVKNEAAPANNGIYLCTTAGAGGVSAVLTRATDSNTSAEIIGGFVFVEKGTANSTTGWANTNTSTITVGVTGITYQQFSGAGTYTAGTGLTLTGNAFSVNTSQNIATLSNLTSNGLLYTSGSAGTLNVATTTIPSAITGSSLTSVGTITTGVWNGTAIANANLANSTISGISLGSNLNALTATDGTLTFSGAYNGSTARTIGLNLGNANTWTGAQVFSTVPLTISGNQSQPAWTTLGTQLVVSAATLTDSSSAAGTVTTNAANAFATSTFATTTNAVTYTNAATVYIAGGPTAGSHVTETNKYALLIAADGFNSTGNSFITAGNALTTFGAGSALTKGFVDVSRGNTSATNFAILSTTIPNSTASSGIVVGLLSLPQVSQTGTAGYTGVLVNATESSTGSGHKYFFEGQVGGSSKFFVDDTGLISGLSLSLGGGTALTTTNQTGTGNLVLATSPTLVTPLLGTPTSGVMTNVTGVASGLTSGITNALASATTTVNVSSATAPTTGQVLTATDSTHATWQTPGAGTPMMTMSTLFETAARFTTTGSLSYGTTGITSTTTNTNMTILVPFNQSNSVASNDNEFAGNPSASFQYTLEAFDTGVNGASWFNIGGSTITGTTSTTKHVGFKLVFTSTTSASLYATQANGTTESVSSALITGIVNADKLDMIVQVSGTTATFYARKNGGTQVSTTLSTNYPASRAGNAYLNLSQSVTNSGGSIIGDFYSASYSR